MTRFGDFTLHEDLGQSATADRYQASHATQGGPFFLKVYSRLDASLHADLAQRCEALMGRAHPNLAAHLGHGAIDGMPFVVSPWLEGIDLGKMTSSLLDRRVTVGLETVLLMLMEVGGGVDALHSIAPGPAGSTHLGHGDVSLGHVRVGLDGGIWLTGLTTPRGDAPGKPPEGRFDTAGVGAMLYDLVPLLRPGGARTPLPPLLDRLVRRALGIGPPEDRIRPAEFAEHLSELLAPLRLSPDRGAVAELARRTVKMAEKLQIEEEVGAVPARLDGQRPPATPPGGAPRGRLPSEKIPSLDPVDRLPTLEPILGAPASQPVGAPSPRAAPAPILELIPLDAPMPREAEASTRLVPHKPPPMPPRRPPTQSMAMPTTPPPTPAPRTATPPPAAPPPTATPPRPPAPPPMPPVAPAIAAPPAAPPPAAPPRAPSPPPTAAPRNPTQPFFALPKTPPPAPPPTAAPPRLPSTLTSSPPPLPRLASPPPMAAPPRTQPASTPPRSASLPSRPLLADPDEAPAPAVATVAPAVNAALVEETNERTDPGDRASRVAAACQQPAMVALVSNGLVPEAAVLRAAEEFATRGGRMLEILVAAGAVTDEGVATAMAAAAARPRLTELDLRRRMPVPALLRRLPQTYVLARRLLPLSLDHGVLEVAVADPFDHATIKELTALLGVSRAELFVAPRTMITSLAVEAYRSLGMGGAVPGSQGDADTVLLCIPDENKAARIGARLAGEGWRIEMVVDGKAAKDILIARPPSAVICAHDIAGESVGALLLFIREQEQTAELPVFVIGPRGDEDLAARILDLGADDFLTEPLKLEVLLSKLRRALRKQSRGAFADLPFTDPSGKLSLPPQASMPSFDDLTPVQGISTLPDAAPPAKRTEQAFLANIPSLDDLPELPPDILESEPDVPAMPTGVMGTLRQMAVAEIVQSLEMGRKTARVDLVPADGEKGMIAFEQGSIRYAECGALRGDEAFYQLARHKEGFFRIHYGDKPPSVNIDVPTTWLLLEAMRRMDEADAGVGST
ncbi:MAG: DUF4388 domain-containing protein [Deltaproteobacteria bacterium]|nr:DUF4388 domain-containing protein [Deltaproteobacteria bacterium]